jgi:GR25 family glycosyltransferase involved in LPS biosynthesis
MWTDFFDKILVINLPSRTDRLLQIAEELYKWGIPYELVNATPHENGAEGLRITVEKIFRDAIADNLNSVLIFEDDAMFVDSCGNPNDTMEQVVKQLPPTWQILYLGAQCTNGFKAKTSSNLLLLDMAFATHAWAISLDGMKEILASGLESPIDNSIVKTVQPNGHTYITYPLLCTQRPGYSDIGRTEINWQPFIEQRYYQKFSESNL